MESFFTNLTWPQAFLLAMLWLGATMDSITITIRHDDGRPWYSRAKKETE